LNFKSLGKDVANANPINNKDKIPLIKIKFPTKFNLFKVKKMENEVGLKKKKEITE